jgi:hypothetical protein
MSKSTHHSFDVSLAAQFGTEPAIIIHHFQHWINHNKSSGKNYRDGRTWSFQTRSEIANWFVYLSPHQVRRITDKLVTLGILIKGNYNKKGNDDTIWYAFVDEEKYVTNVEENRAGKSANPNDDRVGKSANPNDDRVGKSASLVGKSATPLPDTKTDTKHLKNIKEDNVFPTRARENPKPKKDIVLSPEAMEKPKAKALDPERFRRKLDTEQRELHDKLVAFNPEWGESLSSDFVCLLFNDKKPYTVKQIENAFAVYEQDATAARARNRSIRSLSAYLRDALKKGRRPECADFEFNKSHAEFVQKRRPGIKIMKKYAKVMIGKSQHEVDFDLPKAEFIRQLEKLLQLFQDML